METPFNFTGEIPASGAEFSPSKMYRYALWRIWDSDKPLVMFVGLNPSTANESKDDPTIRRVKRFAADNGFGGVLMLNLFGLVSANPSALVEHPDPVCHNDVYLVQYGKVAAEVVFCWGAFKEAKAKAKFAEGYFPNAKCLGRTADGSPKHPLYIPAQTPFIDYLQKK